MIFDYGAWVAMADRLAADPIDLACVSYSESGMRPNAANDGPPATPWHASGLIQFMSPTLNGLGWKVGYQAFRLLTIEQQIPFVERYFTPYKGKLTARWLAYVATFVPASLDAARAGGPDFVLVEKGGRLGWAYEANARAFDENHDFKIQGQELDDAIGRNCHGARWEEIHAGIRQAQGLEPLTVPEPAAYPVGSIAWVQSALHGLGYDTGPIDNANGTLTRRAVIAYQTANELTPDGIVGPNTRASLLAHGTVIA